jgi:hypothetical protein
MCLTPLLGGADENITVVIYTVLLLSVVGMLF